MKVEGERVTEIDRNKETVNIPSTTRYIGQCACISSLLSSLDLESSNIIIIEEYSFSYCSRLKEVIFPSCLQEIREGSFLCCKDLRIIKFGSESQLTKIGDKSFQYCEILERFEFPPLLRNIGELSFDHTRIDIFDLRNTNVSQIGSFALMRGSKVMLPATVTLKSVLNICDCDIDVDERNQFVKRDECGCFFVNGTIINAKKETRRILIRRGVERIGKFCFYKSSLVSLTIPSSVTKISRYAFSKCERLKFVDFSKNSRLNKIGKKAFYSCRSLKKIKFPKSLKVIKSMAFSFCSSLKKLSFPNDSQLERIEAAFQFTNIKHLSFPPSIKVIDNVLEYVNGSKSVYVSNDLFSSNEEGTAILSKDRSELICVIPIIFFFEIPKGVRVIKKGAILGNKYVYIPPSVEIIEKEALNSHESVYNFAPRSKLRSLNFEAFAQKPESLAINNENFITMDNGVVMSLNPRGIVFVPYHLTEIEIDPNVEVIYSWAFAFTKIDSLHFPKSLKKIFSHAFSDSKIRSITFEEGTDLETLGSNAFENSEVDEMNLSIKGRIHHFYSENGQNVLEFQNDFASEIIEMLDRLSVIKVVCPRSSLISFFRQFDHPKIFSFRSFSNNKY